jgi:hypothetical protein
MLLMFMGENKWGNSIGFSFQNSFIRLMRTPQENPETDGADYREKGRDEQGNYLVSGGLAEFQT